MLLQTLPSRLKMVLFPTFTASAARRSAQLKNKVVQRQLAKWFSRRAPFFTALLWRFHHKTFGPFASKGKKTPAEALEAAMAFKGQQGQSQNQKKSTSRSGGTLTQMGKTFRPARSATFLLESLRTRVCKLTRVSMQSAWLR